MTIPATARKAGPFAGNDVATSFPFTFRVFSAGDVAVALADALGVETLLVLDSDYSVTLNVDQTTNPGGSVTYPLSGSPLAAGEQLAITGATEFSQETQLPNGGAYNATIVERALDKATILAQQNDEVLQRVLRFPASDGITVDAATLPLTRVGKYLAFDASGNPVLADGTGSDPALRSDLALSSGSSLVGHLPDGTGAVATTGQEKLRRYYDVFDVMTEAERTDVRSRTGAVDVSTKINAALLAAFTAGHKAVRFPAGEYYCGSYATAVSMFDLVAYGDGFSIITDGFVEFTCTTTADVTPNFFKITNNSNFTCGHIAFRDLGYDPLITWHGARGIAIEATGTAFQDINIDSISCRDMVTPLVIGGTFTTRVKNINVGAIFSNNCYYGCNLANQGDNVKIGAIYAYQNNRPVFVYGTDGFEATVYSNHNRATSGAINISRSIGGYNTSGVKIRYIARDMADTARHVLINHVDLLGGTISGVNLEIDIEGSISYYPVFFVNYDGAGNETAAASSNVVEDVTITGTVNSSALAIAAVATYATATSNVNISESEYLAPAASLYTAFDVRLLNGINPPGSFTPTVAGTSTAGVGTYSVQLGRYTKIGSRCFFDVAIVQSAHTGTGNMTVSLSGIPFNPKNVNASFGWNCSVVYSGLTVGAGKEIGAQVQNNAKTINLYAQDQAGGALALIAMDATCSIFVSGNFEIA